LGLVGQHTAPSCPMRSARFASTSACASLLFARAPRHRSHATPRQWGLALSHRRTILRGGDSQPSGSIPQALSETPALASLPSASVIGPTRLTAEHMHALASGDSVAAAACLFGRGDAHDAFLSESMGLLLRCMLQLKPLSRQLVLPRLYLCLFCCSDCSSLGVLLGLAQCPNVRNALSGPAIQTTRVST